MTAVRTRLMMVADPPAMATLLRADRRGGDRAVCVLPRTLE
jgi:hypothetical protein